jgi:hypothetical protein
VINDLKARREKVRITIANNTREFDRLHRMLVCSACDVLIAAGTVCWSAKRVTLICRSFPID